jgi:branched-chain amino acid transport system ATP-binding protein
MFESTSTSQQQNPVPEKLLEIRDIGIWFGGIAALDGVSFDLEPGVILGLIGPNGAGKTTLFNCISRLYTPRKGEIRFEGKSILNESPHRIAELGIGRTFQNLALFESMTVLDNIVVGGHCASRSDFFSDALRLPWIRREERRLRQKVWDLIQFLELEGIAHMPVAALPFGTRKRVELARALATEPKLLLLDEPASGLNHEEVEELGDLIRGILKEQQVTILLVEHHMNLVMRVSDHVVVLDFGRKIAEGPPSDIQHNQDVIRAYLGTAD